MADEDRPIFTEEGYPNVEHLPAFTPKPTAEERLDNIDAALDRIEQREKERASLNEYVRLMHRRKAFEEAADQLEKILNEGYDASGGELLYLVDRWRALAKEQGK